MLDLFGRRYVVEHCINHIKRSNQEKLFRTYLTDALKVLTENTQHAFGGSAMSARWAELANPVVEKRSAEDITNHVLDAIANLGGDADEFT